MVSYGSFQVRIARATGDGFSCHWSTSGDMDGTLGQPTVFSGAISDFGSVRSKQNDHVSVITMVKYRWIGVIVLGLVVISYRAIGHVVQREAVVVVVGVAILSLFIGWGLLRTSGDHTDGQSADSSVWDAIPSWQYEGRHVESGGLARAEQEQALREIEQTAEEMSEEHPRFE